MRVFGNPSQHNGKHAHIGRVGFEQPEKALKHTIDDFGVDTLHLLGIQR